MFLIPEDRYNSLISESHEKASPSVASEIMPENDQIIETSRTLQRTPTRPESEALSEHEARNKLGVETILAFIPLRLIARARSMLSFLEWNKKGELIYDGKCIKGSHVIDLVRSLVQPRINYSELRGISELCMIMRKCNVPLTMVCNPELRSCIASMADDTDAEVESPVHKGKTQWKWLNL